MDSLSVGIRVRKRALELIVYFIQFINKIKLLVGLINVFIIVSYFTPMTTYAMAASGRMQNDYNNNNR